MNTIFAAGTRVNAGMDRRGEVVSSHLDGDLRWYVIRLDAGDMLTVAAWAVRRSSTPAPVVA